MTVRTRIYGSQILGHARGSRGPFTPKFDFLLALLSLFLLLSAETARTSPPGHPTPVMVSSSTPSTGISSTASTSTAPVGGDDENTSVEALGITARGTFSEATASVGDTVHFHVRVEWADQRIPVVVLPPESLSTPGFRVVGQSTAHRKSASGEGIRNVTEFAIALIGLTPGTGRVEPLRLRYRTALGPREESLYIPTATLELTPAPVAWSERAWVRVLLLLLLLGGAAVGFRFGFKSWKARREATKPVKRDFSGEAAELKTRLKSADSRAWLKDAEALCLDYLNQETAPAEPYAQFDKALDAFYKRRGPDQPRQEWEALRELFVQARWSAERREPHELADAHRTLKHCLQIEGEPE